MFWWMVENHNEMAAAAGARISWKTFVEAATGRGLTDTRGEAITETNARQTWRRAKAAVASGSVKFETEEGRRKPKYPSRVSPDWRPREVPQTPLRALPSPIPGPAPLPIGDKDEATMEARGKAELDRIRAELAAHDAKKFRLHGL